MNDEKSAAVEAARESAEIAKSKAIGADEMEQEIDRRLAELSEESSRKLAEQKSKHEQELELLRKALDASTERERQQAEQIKGQQLAASLRRELADAAALTYFDVDGFISAASALFEFTMDDTGTTRARDRNGRFVDFSVVSKTTLAAHDDLRKPESFSDKDRQQRGLRPLSKADLKTAKEKSDWISRNSLAAFEALPLKAEEVEPMPNNPGLMNRKQWFSQSVAERAKAISKMQALGLDPESTISAILKRLG